MQRRDRRVLTLQERFPESWITLDSLNGVRDWKPEWLIRDFILKNGTNYLAGPGKLGKSYLRTQLVVACLSGADIFDMEASRPQNVLLLMGERRKELEGQRIFSVGEKLGLSDAEIARLPITMLEPTEFKLDRANHLDSLIATVEEDGFDLVIIDPLKAFHDQVENAAEKIGVVNNFFRSFCKQTTLWIIHHEGKPSEAGGSFFTKGRSRTVGERLRGSSDMGAAADAIVAMEKTSKNVRELEFETNWAEERDKMRLTFKNGLFVRTASSAKEAVKLEMDENSDATGAEIAKKHHFRKADVLDAMKGSDDDA